MDNLIERVAKAPAGMKLVVVVVALVIVTLLNLFVVGIPWGSSISAMESRRTRAQAEFRKLDSEFIEKQSIANDLNRFRRERELLQQRLNDALTELPEKKNLDELLQMFQDRALKSGLEIVSIEPKEQVNSGFYAKIPIQMKIDGSFHEIATFFDAMGRLRRIVNVSDIVLDNPKDVNGKVVVKASFTATTFMFVDPKAAAAVPAKPGSPKGSK